MNWNYIWKHFCISIILTLVNINEACFFRHTDELNEDLFLIRLFNTRPKSYHSNRCFRLYSPSQYHRFPKSCFRDWDLKVSCFERILRVFFYRHFALLTFELFDFKSSPNPFRTVEFQSFTGCTILNAIESMMEWIKLCFYGQDTFYFTNFSEMPMIPSNFDLDYSSSECTWWL